MSYRILAQKYRPQVFEDVVGQDTVTRTLKNSFNQGRIANAYIFCGPRGVGKTSIARLLSKALNCKEDPSKAPCNKCDSCLEITKGNSIDVLEIDGASNNRVDEIRVLLENVQFAPSKGKYKIYIIDEVHMLSAGAFNALLKTLEEPPAHVKFIFATTEQHKVLPTIMSRCQRFDFKRIPPGLILERLKAIAEQEKIPVDEKAALLIARSSDGSLRDALVILDQMVSFSSGTITADEVVDLLGMVRKDKIFELSDAVINNDPVDVTRILDGMIDSGKDPVFIANSMISHYRDLMVIKTTSSPTRDMAFSEDELDRIRDQVEKLTIEEILYILQNLLHCLTLMKGAMFTRAPLEVALIRLTRRGMLLSMDEILKRLEKLDTGIGDHRGPEAFSSASGKVPSYDAVPKTSSNNLREGLSGASLPSNAGVDIEEEEDETLGADAASGGTFNWKSILNYVKNRKISVYTFLNVARPIEFTDKKVTIGFSKAHTFNKDALETGTNKSIIEEAVNKVTGAFPKLEFTLIEEGPDPDKEKEEALKVKSKVREEMKPVIESAMDVFGGHVVRDLMEES